MPEQDARANEGHKFGQKLEMTTEEIYSFFYGSIVPALQAAHRDGGEAFLRSLTAGAVDNVAKMISAMVKDMPVRDTRALAELYRTIMSTSPYDKVFTCEVTQQSEQALELKFTECLPAKLLRAMGATDIGCSLECSGGHGVARAFNPRMQFSNPKNMMKGDPYCIERYDLRP